MKEIKPLKKTYAYETKISIFLAGSIEQGKAEEWQKKVVDEFKDYKDLVIFNLNTKKSPSLTSLLRG